jgi:hypothetical protein
MLQEATITNDRMPPGSNTNKDTAADLGPEEESDHSDSDSSNDSNDGEIRTGHWQITNWC